MIVMGGNHSRPSHPNPAPWVVSKRIRRGGSPIRSRPADFEQVFVEIGRLACQEHYHARRQAITRWLEECGKFRLLELRREHVRRRAIEARVGKAKADAVRKLEQDTASALGLADPRIAALAADYLRKVCNGGWQVSRTEHGDWWVGTVVRNSASLIAFAERHGFDRRAADLRGKGGSGVGSER